MREKNGGVHPLPSHTKTALDPGRRVLITKHPLKDKDNQLFTFLFRNLTGPGQMEEEAYLNYVSAFALAARSSRPGPAHVSPLLPGSPQVPVTV